MQWILLGFWGMLIFYGTLISARWLRPVISLGLLGAMGTQLWLLQLDGLFTLESALPLHLCSLFGVLSVLMLWKTPGVLHEALCFLGAPGAFLTLFFPAVAPCSHPWLMQAAFYQLHVLVTLTPMYFHLTGKPLPCDPRRTLMLGSGYVVCICLINRVLGSNYLFLRAAPAGTPLEPLFLQGPAFYLCALEMLCMLLLSWLRPFYAYLRKYVII